MPDPPVPATVSVKYGRAHNADTDRLTRRLLYLVHDLDPSQVDARSTLRHRARELHAVRALLIRLMAMLP